MNIKLRVEKMVFGGQCLGRFENKVIFVWNALPGEEVEVELIKNKKDFAEGIATKIIQPSPHRLPPREDHFMICSPWQIISWEEENRWKREICLETYIKIGGLPKETALDVISADENQYGYRNKMEYSFAIKDNKISLGFFERGERRHISIDGCELAEDGINRTAKVILDWINSQRIPIRSLKSLIIRSNNQKQTIAALFIKDKMNFADYPELSNNFLGFHLYYSDHRCPASRPDLLLYTAGQDYLIANINGKKMKYGLLSFFQINIPVFARAVNDIAKFLNKEKSVVDFYSGVGAIGLALADYCKGIVFVDNNREAIAYAKENIELNNLQNKCRAEFSGAENITSLIEHEKIIIFDPPRAGLHEDIINTVLDEKPEKIIYLSCNVSTHARDIKLLSPAYRIKFLKLYNFFPRTPHVESLCILERK